MLFYFMDFDLENLRFIHLYRIFIDEFDNILDFNLFNILLKPTYLFSTNEIIVRSIERP